MFDTYGITDEPHLVGCDHDVLQDERREEQQLVVGERVELVAGDGFAEGHADEALEGAAYIDLRPEESLTSAYAQLDRKQGPFRVMLHHQHMTQPTMKAVHQRDGLGRDAELTSVQSNAPLVLDGELGDDGLRSCGMSRD